MAERKRPLVAGTVAADVAARLADEHAKRGGPFGHALEAVLRRGLGLPPIDAPTMQESTAATA